MDDEYQPTPDALAPPPPPPSSRPPRRLGGLGRSGAAAITAIGLASGGVAGGFLISHAATTSPTATPSAPSAPSRGAGHTAGHGPFRVGQSAELQTIATAIGITTTQLETEVRTGKSIADVARAHGVDPSKVINELIAADTKGIDAALAAGKLNKTQADAAKAALTQRVGNEVNNAHGFRPGGFGPGGFGPGGFGPKGVPGAAGEDQQVIATAIGITTAQLQTELKAGSTIAQVAKAHKVDPNAVISALVASENKEIDDAVTKGKIAQAQATKMKAMTQQRVTDMVNRAFTPWHRGGPAKPPASPTQTP